MSKAPPRLTLLILDGFGLSPALEGNAIAAATLPTLDRLVSFYPFVGLTAHGTEVGLRWGEMGNSEVGHLNLGAGRVVLQEVTKIFSAIDSGKFFENAVLQQAINGAKASGRLHLVGLMSNGGVHGHVEHMTALLEFAQRSGVKDVVMHLITDGRDSEPKSAMQFLPILEQARVRYGGRYATVMGRYYAMDRDRRFDRTEAAYKAMVEGSGSSSNDIVAAIAEAYERGESDEFIAPTVLNPTDPTLRISKGDTVIMTNFRADRARQLASAFAGKQFDEFTRPKLDLSLITFTNYGVELSGSTVAFPVEPIRHSLASVLSAAGLSQLHIAETEKYAHATYFFNGGIEEPFLHEKRILVASPRVGTYDEAPAMAVEAITAHYLEAYAQGVFNVAVMNFANPDMVGHTGKLDATVASLEVLDGCLAQIVATVESAGDLLVITADHGNAEQLIHPDTGDIDKEHTANPVPLLLVGSAFRRQVPLDHPRLNFMSTGAVGILADVAPTILDLLGIAAPSEMTGRSLLPELKRR